MSSRRRTSVSLPPGAGGGGGSVTSVAGKTGVVTLDKADVAGIDQVTNTSDANKPLSTAAVTALAAKADLVGGLIPTAQLPPLAINETFTPADQAAMLALTAQRGDMAIRQDNGKTYVLAADAPGTLANWKEVLAAGQVQSVAGKTGVVSLVKADVGLNLADNTADANKPVSGPQETRIGGVETAASISTDDDNLLHRGVDGKLHVDGNALQPAGAYLTAADLENMPRLWVLQAGQTAADVPAGFPASTGTRWSVILRLRS